MDPIYHLLTLGGLLFISQLSPGPDFLLVFRMSLAEGWRAGASFGLGITLGFTIQVSLVCWLGSKLLHWEGAPYLQLLAGAYLLYLSWGILPRKQLAQHFGWSKQENSDINDGMSDIAEVKEKRPLSEMLIKGFLCNIVNVKCLLFLAGICLHGLESYTHITWYIPALIIWFFIVSAGGWTIWSCLLQWRPLREGYRKRVWLIDSIFATLLLGMACVIAENAVESLIA